MSGARGASGHLRTVSSEEAEAAAQEVPSIIIRADGQVLITGEWRQPDLLAAIHREYLFQEELFRSAMRAQVQHLHERHDH